MIEGSEEDNRRENGKDDLNPVVYEIEDSLRFTELHC
jgi:hypothetical protein